MGIIIRKALPEDAYDYTVCAISSRQSAYKGIVPDEYLDNMLVEKEQQVEKIRKNLTDPDIESYCVIYESKMIGFLAIYKRHAEIGAIYLIKDFWGKGYGKEMLDFATNELKSEGHKKIFLWVFEENNRARRFYEKHGFSFDGTKRENDKYGKMLVQLKYTLELD